MQNIPDTPKERIEWLKDAENRDAIKRMGAGAIYYRGDLSDINSICVIVSTRSGNVGGGLAHFGGLSEEEDKVLNDELATGINNACREGREEMEELLGYQPDLEKDNYAFLYAAHDDGFFIRNGKGFAIDARIHSYKIDDCLWEEFFPENAKISDRHENHEGFEETEKAEPLTFKDAMTRQQDYHYPHEYFSLWVMAAKMIDVDVMELLKDLNSSMSPERIDFTKLALDMNIEISELENHLGQGYKGKLQEYECNCKAAVHRKSSVQARQNNYGS